VPFESTGISTDVKYVGLFDNFYNSKRLYFVVNRMQLIVKILKIQVLMFSPHRGISNHPRCKYTCASESRYIKRGMRMYTKTKTDYCRTAALFE